MVSATHPQTILYHTFGVKTSQAVDSHLHCIIPAGVLSFDRTRWTCIRRKYLFRVQSLAKEFKKRYLSKLEKAHDKNLLSFPDKVARLQEKKEFLTFIETLRGKQWITYAKHPFGGPEQVLEYLVRDTHRIAITNKNLPSVLKSLSGDFFCTCCRAALPKSDIMDSWHMPTREPESI